ncbi:MAG TPA: hypothetical protein PKD53_03795 [Chloroflexaceae bacterium]|nr:hypothetical protein [Chloroflexaceae bacterium]
MKQLRVRVGVSIIWLLLLAFLDSLNVFPVLQFSPGFFLGVAVIVLLSVLIPLRVGTLLAIAATVALAYMIGAVLAPDLPITAFGQPSALIELFFLELTVLFAYISGKALYDADNIFRHLVLPPGYTRLVTFSDFVSQLQAEIGRARRHQREMSLAVLTLDAKQNEALFQQTVHAIKEQLAMQAAAKRFGLMLGREIRETDVVTQHPKTGQFLLLTPETAPQAATQLVERLVAKTNSELGGELHYSISSFPGLALTPEGLLKVVMEASPGSAWGGMVVPPASNLPPYTRSKEVTNEQTAQLSPMSDARQGD